MSPILTSILLGLTAAAANVFGGAVIVQKHWERSYLRYFVALGAGFMLATALVEMVPESLALAGRNGALLVLAGYLLVHSSSTPSHRTFTTARRRTPTNMFTRTAACRYCLG
jgi:zinc transporter ZupT